MSEAKPNSLTRVIMSKKAVLMILFLLISKVLIAQHLKLDNSILVTSYTNNKDLPILHDKLSVHSISLGADYLDKKWFYLSSQLGYFKIGGKENYYEIEPQKSSYIHLNTTFRIYKEYTDLVFFIGAGPYLNILTGSKKFETLDYRDYYDKKTYVGGKGEIGVTCDINRFRIGIIGNYMLSVTPTASSTGLNLKNNNLGGSISIGYLLF